MEFNQSQTTFIHTLTELFSKMLKKPPNLLKLVWIKMMAPLQTLSLDSVLFSNIAWTTLNVVPEEAKETVVSGDQKRNYRQAS